MHSISYLQALILGLIQGISELFPVSSLGHSVILPKLFGWSIDQSSAAFVTFLVATHLATALVLLGFFSQEWLAILAGLWRSITSGKIAKNDTSAKLGWLLVLGTIPAGILGVLLQSRLQQTFASAQSAAFVLILNGLLLFGAERLSQQKAAARHQAVEPAIAKLNWWQALGVGLAQALALIPGFSRSGSSMAGGLLVGLDTEAAARFSFLLATPIILAAGVLKLPTLLHHTNAAYRGPDLVGAIAAGIGAYLSVRFLTRYFSSNRLTPFAIYCVVGGVIYSLLLLFR